MERGRGLAGVGVATPLLELSCWDEAGGGEWGGRVTVWAVPQPAAATYTATMAPIRSCEVAMVAVTLSGVRQELVIWVMCVAQLVSAAANMPAAHIVLPGSTGSMTIEVKSPQR